MEIFSSKEECEKWKTEDIEMEEYIYKLKINECIECEEIKRVQRNHHINVAPLFWQGRGTPNIPLVIMGINPSVVGTLNEPQRGRDFKDYFRYYQYRNESEAVGGKRLEYWTKCQYFATRILGNGTQRWTNYVLMEAIHCFYNRANDLEKEDSQNVARRCFDKYTKDILLQLKPRRMILVGKPPYELLYRKGYLGKNEIRDCEYCSLQIENLRLPVLRVPYPSYGRSCREDVYDEFISYCNDFNYEL